MQKRGESSKPIIEINKKALSAGTRRASIETVNFLRN